MKKTTNTYKVDAVHYAWVKLDKWIQHINMEKKYHNVFYENYYKDKVICKIENLLLYEPVMLKNILNQYRSF